jgi:hypothetical protein
MSHLKTQGEKDSFKEYLLGTSSLWERLSTLLEEKLPKPKEEDYDKGSWAYYQADQNGYERALREVLTLLPIDK